MKKLRLRLFILIGVLMCFSLALNITLYCAYNINPNKLVVQNAELKSSKIPESLNEVSIVYFTDLQYGEYENNARTKKVFNAIKELNPDILIFGGDFFDTDFETTDKINQKMIDYLNDIEAPLGKYAVWGEKDTESEEHQNALNYIYSQAQVEVLSDSVVKVTNQSNEGINILGLSLKPNYEYLVANTSSESYNLVVSHKPDSLTDSMLSLASINYALAGHSHGTQVTFPIFGGYKTVSGAKTLNRNENVDLNFDYTISAGVGCTNIDARLNATPEIHYFILKTK